MNFGRESVCIANVLGLGSAACVAVLQGALNSYTITDILHSNLLSLFCIAVFFAISCAITDLITNSACVWTIAICLGMVTYSRTGWIHDIGAVGGFGAMTKIAHDLGFSIETALLVGVPLMVAMLWIAWLLDLGKTASVEYSLFVAVNVSLLLSGTQDPPGEDYSKTKGEEYGN